MTYITKIDAARQLKLASGDTSNLAGSITLGKNFIANTGQILTAPVGATDIVRLMDVTASTDATVVHKTGNLTEFINGYKTFANEVQINVNPSNDSHGFSISGSNIPIILYDSGNTQQMQFGAFTNTVGVSGWGFQSAASTLLFNSEDINITAGPDGGGGNNNVIGNTKLYGFSNINNIKLPLADFLITTVTSGASIGLNIFHVQTQLNVPPVAPTDIVRLMDLSGITGTTDVNVVRLTGYTNQTISGNLILSTLSSTTLVTSSATVNSTPVNPTDVVRLGDLGDYALGDNVVYLTGGTNQMVNGGLATDALAVNAINYATISLSNSVNPGVTATIELSNSIISYGGVSLLEAPEYHAGTGNDGMFINSTSVERRTDGGTMSDFGIFQSDLTGFTTTGFINIESPAMLKFSDSGGTIQYSMLIGTANTLSLKNSTGATIFQIDQSGNVKAKSFVPF